MTDELKNQDLPPDDRPFGDLPLAALPPLDIAPERAEQIRRRAHSILRAEQSAPRVGSFAHRYHRNIEPALLIGLSVCQLLWTAHGMLQLWH
jgi:hypothetical protein